MSQHVYGVKNWKTISLLIQQKEVSLTSFCGSALVACCYHSHNGAFKGYGCVLFVKDRELYEDQSLRERLRDKSSLLECFFTPDGYPFDQIIEYEIFSKWLSGPFYRELSAIAEDFDLIMCEGAYEK